MTRPMIVRADTIDLQNPDAPSAKNHGRQHLHPTESTAPHQASTLREVAHETAEEEARSPHLSWNSGFATEESHKEEQEDLAAGVRGRMTQQEQEDQLAIAQNGGVSSSDEGEDDGDLDDDMMDRISSSPSIEDEGENLEPAKQGQRDNPAAWPYYDDSSDYSEDGFDEEEADDRRCAELKSGEASILATLLEEDEDEEGDDYDGDDDTGSPEFSNDTDYSEFCFAASECLPIDSEDIDFDFVYALHTFVATVEGQANATKGDTMVLLDDSNSYWWLVRVVKDSSIGYLPAEHIETPTERLARWNKHRNVDLSAAMLGDNPQKQKSTLNKIRKRWKTVTFTEPTYVDYSDIDYSSDEEDIEELFGRDVTAGSGQDQDQQQDQKDKQDKEQKDSQQDASDDDMVDERAKVEPLKTGSAGVSKVDSKEEAKADGSKDGDDVEIETRDSTELLGGHVDMVGRSRNGTMRNTDSFFKDDTAETKKITLTPNLLRDDLGSRPSTDSISTKDKARPSLESKMDREFVSDKDKKKQKEKEKKDKEKKPSTIRSFFSRKDKKRTSEDDDNSSGKRSMDIMSEPRQSEDPMADEQQPRSAAKPQKPQARVEPSLVRKNSTQKKSSEITNPFSETRTNDVSNVPPSTMRIVDPETQETREVSSNQQQAARERSQRDEKPAIGKPQQPSVAAAQPQRVAAAQSRMDLDDSDSSDAAEALLHETPEPAQTPTPVIKVETERVRSPHVPGAFPVLSPKGAPTVRAVSPEQDMDRLSESPIEVSPISPINPHQPPGLMADYAHSPSPEGSPSPDLVHVGENFKENEAEAPQEPAWDDTKLRAFFDEGKHVRDLLAVVYDTSDVEPSDSSAGSLFREQNARLAEITTQLDNMLGDWLARKQRSRGTLL
ncbi:unnamed protein product [Clonostachys byssicola]|uniref:SH3 domain-containing protein n=1 Tax=Clonostachys byssicola TaxID=160290 RepID=A0A9N9Y525_9HYPO|nr:unnamed protein product [Clonostachys byssicola]